MMASVCPLSLPSPIRTLAPNKDAGKDDGDGNHRHREGDYTACQPRSQIDNLYLIITTKHTGPHSLGSVTPRCAWYLPFLSLYDVPQGSSL